jgi:hypothetical protein
MRLRRRLGTWFVALCYALHRRRQGTEYFASIWNDCFDFFHHFWISFWICLTELKQQCGQFSSGQKKGSHFLDPLKRPKNAQKTPQNAQNAPKRPKTPPKRPQNAPKTPVFWRLFCQFRSVFSDPGSYFKFPFQTYFEED